MELPAQVTEFVRGLPALEGLGVVVAVLLFVLWRRSGIFFSRMELENRKLRKGIRNYRSLERDHIELSQENRERNRVHGELPLLIARLNEERSLSGIARHLVEFASRALEASNVSLFLADGPDLRLRESTGDLPRDLRLRIGEGRVGAVAEFRRTMMAEDFQNLDPELRRRLGTTGAHGIDTVAAAALVAHGRLIGVLNVGGNVLGAKAIRRELVSVIAQLGATALENQLNFERLEREATTDGLTGLSNVRNFREKFRQELSRATRFGRPLSVFLFDLDHFNNYNDRNGHPAGDECLRLTAEILRNNTRATDLPARYGGEEFVVLLPETDADGALAFAEKIRTAIASTDYPHREAQPLGCVSISGGVATAPRHGADVATLIEAADVALYACKEAGRNRVVRARDPGPDEPRAAAGR